RGIHRKHNHQRADYYRYSDHHLDKDIERRDTFLVEFLNITGKKYLVAWQCRKDSLRHLILLISLLTFHIDEAATIARSQHLLHRGKTNLQTRTDLWFVDTGDVEFSPEKFYLIANLYFLILSIDRIDDNIIFADQRRTFAHLDIGHLLIALII